MLEQRSAFALRAHAEAMHSIEVLAVDTPDDTRSKGLTKTVLSEAARDARKERMMIDFIQGLRQAAREDSDAKTGVTVFVIPKYQVRSRDPVPRDLEISRSRDLGSHRICDPEIPGLGVRVLTVFVIVFA
jgi:hypothetical protein